MSEHSFTHADNLCFWLSSEHLRSPRSHNFLLGKDLRRQLSALRISTVTCVGVCHWEAEGDYDEVGGLCYNKSRRNNEE